MLTLTRQGLFCQAGNFHIDPKSAVENAIVTHAHSDHARRGARQYFSAQSGVELLKTRLGKNISVRGLQFGERVAFNNITVSLHPAGHILGSAQVRIESPAGEVWVASGDYKRDADPTCEPFEPVECDVFVTEATFGTPAYQWKKDLDLGREIFEWWQSNAAQGLNSVLFAYSLGKAQRVLGVLEPHATRAIYCHPAAAALTQCYRNEGVKLAPTKCLSEVQDKQELKGELVLVPQAFLQTPRARVLGENYRTAFASGWMAKGTYGSGFDKGFVMSDHADWNDLVRTVAESKAKRVYVQHRGKGALVQHLRKMGLLAYPDSALRIENPDQLSLFT